jgi:hypothetical protein
VIAVNRIARAMTVNTPAATPLFEKNLGGRSWFWVIEYVKLF